MDQEQNGTNGQDRTGTGAEIDTRLTQQFAERLRALVEEHGADSLIGRLCMTIVSQLRNLPGYVRPAWATHESQTLQGKIMWQIAQLEAALFVL